MIDCIGINEVDTTDRMRKDFGDIAGLAKSIKEFGLIQPIVLGISGDTHPICRLVAGGRRLTALKALGVTHLVHVAVDKTGHYIWNHEQDEYNLRSIEVEENLRRKELTWQEEVEGKRLLLELMQKKHGVAKVGQPASNDPTRGGFGVVKLAAMLGETPRQTAKDLQVAAALKMAPALAKQPTKESAHRNLNMLVQVGQMQLAGQAAAKAHAASGAATKPKLWTLYEGDFKANATSIPDATVDLVYTDLPFGVGLNTQSNHVNGAVSYIDDRGQVLSDLPEFAQQAYRVLRRDRFAVFFFGFNYYTEICNELERAGFGLNRVPFIWYRRVGSCENPNSRYANGYDPAIVAWKGSPLFMRPGQLNVVEIPAVPAGTKLQVAQQPEALPAKFIEDMTGPGALVVDFCAGSGTTGVAAVKLGRRVALFEREPQACELIKARMGVL